MMQPKLTHAIVNYFGHFAVPYVVGPCTDLKSRPRPDPQILFEAQSRAGT